MTRKSAEGGRRDRHVRRRGALQGKGDSDRPHRVSAFMAAKKGTFKTIICQNRPPIIVEQHALSIHSGAAIYTWSLVTRVERETDICKGVID